MKKHRIFCIALTLVMSLAVLAGCGTSTQQSTAIKIGGIGPLTGGAATYGTSVANAAKLAVEEINALGGLQFELNFKTTSMMPKNRSTPTILSKTGACRFYAEPSPQRPASRFRPKLTTTEFLPSPLSLFAQSCGRKR